jgi:hypothetical protein
MEARTSRLSRLHLGPSGQSIGGLKNEHRSYFREAVFPDELCRWFSADACWRWDD